MPAFARSVAAALALVVGVALATPASAGPATEREAIVQARALGRNGPATPVQFGMVRDASGRWRVYDVSFEGMSLVGSYRAQFHKIIRGSSFAELVSRLEAKIRIDASASTGDTPVSAP